MHSCWTSSWIYVSNASLWWCTLRKVHKVIVAICAALRKQHLEHWVWSWTLQKMRVGRNGFHPARGIPVLQHKAMEEGLGDQGLFLHKWALRGVLIPQFVENTEPAFPQICTGKDSGQWTQAAASGMSNRCEKTMFHYEGSRSGAEKDVWNFHLCRCSVPDWKGPWTAGFKFGLTWAAS